MSDFGQLLISKIIADGNIRDALAAGVRKEWFPEEENRRVFEWLVQYDDRYSKCPSVFALTSQFPNYRRLKTDDTYSFYIDKAREQRTRWILGDMLMDATEHLNNDDLKRVQDRVNTGMLQLGLETSQLTDIDAVADFDARYERYDEARKNVGQVTGIRTGFPTLDLASGGWQPQQFILFGGMPKQGKSFVLMHSAVNAQEQGKRVLFVTFEMSAHEQLARYDALISGVNAQRFLHKNLTDPDMKKFADGKRMHRNFPAFVISEGVQGSTTVSALSGKIEQHRPDIIFVDGVYLMDNEVNAEPYSTPAYTSISRGLKRMAQRSDRPVVGTTQALSSKMKGNNEVTMHSLGWTSAWSQDADAILGVEKTVDSSGGSSIMLRMVAARSFTGGTISLSCNWEETSILEVPRSEHEMEDAYSG